MAINNLWVRKFDRDRDFTVRRLLTVGKRQFNAGDTFDKSLVTTRRLRQLYDARKIMFSDNTETQVRHSTLQTLVHSPGNTGYIEHPEIPPINPENAQNDPLELLNIFDKNPIIIFTGPEGQEVKGKVSGLNVRVDDQGVSTLVFENLTPVLEDENDPAATNPPTDETPADDVETEEVDETAPSVETLRAEAETLGIQVDGRWGQKRLSKEIEKAKASNGESS